MFWWLAGVVQAVFAALCASVVAAFLVLVCIPRLHMPVRARLRPLAILEVENGLSWVYEAQRFRRPWLTTLFSHSSHSVSVTFYASVLPILFWLGLPELGRDLVFMMALAVYVGNAIKDLVCAPRPLGLSYGRQRLLFLGGSDEEVEKNAKEYGLPSSHTLNTLCLNYLFVWYLYDRQLITTGTAAALYCLVALWVVWIAASRIYLGFHTPVDILAGAVAGLAVLVCYIAIEGLITRWLLSGPQAVAHAALACLVLLRLHPRPLAHTPSYEFSTCFLGAMFGVVAGVAWISPHMHQPGVQLVQLWSAGGVGTLRGSRLLFAARRMGVGFLVVGLLKEVSRAVLLAVLPFLYRFFPLSVRRLWQPPVHNLYMLPPTEEQQQQQETNGQPGAAPNGQLRQRRHGPPDRNGTTDDGTVHVKLSNGKHGSGSSNGTRPGPSKAPSAGPVPDPRLLAALPHNPKGVPWDVDVTSRFFAYASIGVAVAGVTPRIFLAMGW